MSLVCVYPVFHWGYLVKKYCQKSSFQKEIRGEWLYRGELSIEGGLNSLDTVTMFHVYNKNYE